MLTRQVQRIALTCSLFSLPPTIVCFQQHSGSSIARLSTGSNGNPLLFQKGDSYTWLYRRKSDGVPSSWERYSVVEVDYPKLVIEMASKFTAEAPYKTHHRMTVNLESQLQAVNRETDWQLDKFEHKDKKTGDWIMTGQGENVLAFEEKFNVFVMVAPRWRRTLHRWTAKYVGNNISVNRPFRHHYTKSWYGVDPMSIAGVAVWKDFGAYTFVLIGQQRNGKAEVFDLNIQNLESVD